LIFDKDKILFNATSKITTKDEVQNSDFYNTYEESNSLFIQMYYLQLSDFIKKSLEEFSKSEDAKFIEKINILYVEENLTSGQISDLTSEHLLDISYEKIAFLEELNELAKEDVL
jgi:hypothetical protein